MEIFIIGTKSIKQIMEIFIFGTRVFQVGHGSRHCTQSIRIIFFQFSFIFTEGVKRGNVTNCGNGTRKSLLSHGLTTCALNEKQK